MLRDLPPSGAWLAVVTDTHRESTLGSLTPPFSVRPCSVPSRADRITSQPTVASKRSPSVNKEESQDCLQSSSDNHRKPQGEMKLRWQIEVSMPSTLSSSRALHKRRTVTLRFRCVWMHTHTLLIGIFCLFKNKCSSAGWSPDKPGRWHMPALGGVDTGSQAGDTCQHLVG